jgi:hypothetical protein
MTNGKGEGKYKNNKIGRTSHTMTLNFRLQLVAGKRGRKKVIPFWAEEVSSRDDEHSLQVFQWFFLL